MVDITVLGSALSSIKTATEIAKIIKDSSDSLEKAEVKLKIAEMIIALADIKMELADVQNLLIEKDKNITDLEERLDTKQSLFWSKPYYLIKKGDKDDGPFCQPCYDTENKLIRLQGGGEDYWNCFTCKSAFTDSNYVRKPLPRRKRSSF